jgi:hypothetical protein
MTAIRALFVSLLFGVLTATSTGALLAAVAAAPDCATMAADAGSSDGCCDGDDGLRGCELACALGHAGAIGSHGRGTEPAWAAVEFGPEPAGRRFLTLPPDTAPPKSSSA